jgi:hypothetical protein
MTKSKRIGVPQKPVAGPAPAMKVVSSETQDFSKKPRLTKLERLARKEASQSIRIAAVGGFGSNSPNIMQGDSSFYSPQLSTDFMELPQSEREKRELFRFWYTTHPIVGASIDFHTDVPMSKIRLSVPKGKDGKRNQDILHFYEVMCKRIRLFQTLYDATHEYWLHGNVFMFCEDHDMEAEVPEDLLSSLMNGQDPEDGYDYSNLNRPGRRRTQRRVPKPKTEALKAIDEWAQKNYRGWQSIRILPPEQIKLEVFQYTNRVSMELIPSEKDKILVMKAEEQKDPTARRIAEDIPEEIRENLLNGSTIPLQTSPYDNFMCSSFCHHLAHKKSAYDDRGISILERCLRTLLYQDKLRQAQTSIASRAMTPKRVVWADKASTLDVDDIRDQVDQALIDPDFTIVTNYELHWDEIGSRDRLLDLGTEYEITNKLLYIGLRITESMLTGESSYSGERIHLDVMNTMYLLYRETISEFVEEMLFKPVAEKKGFFEIDENGNKTYLYPKLQFTRLALRDNTELLDFMYNLYQKGSMPIDYIYDLINIDPESAHLLLRKDLWTTKDPNFNDFSRAVLEKAADGVVDGSDVLEKLMAAAGLKSTEKKKSRFSAEE